MRNDQVEHNRIELVRLKSQASTISCLLAECILLPYHFWLLVIKSDVDQIDHQ